MANTLKKCQMVKIFIEFHRKKINSMPDCTFRDCLLLLKSLNARFDRLFLLENNRKVIIKDMSVDDILKSEKIMNVSAFESWITIDNRQ